MPKPPAFHSAVAQVTSRVYGSLEARARSKNDVVYPLTVGDTYLEPPPVVRDAVAELVPRDFNYASVHGEPALVDAVRRDLERRTGVRRSPREVQITSGGTAGIDATVRALVAPGEEVLLVAPFWPLVRGIVALANAVPVEVALVDRYAETRAEVVAAIEAHVSPRTVALYVNSPHNPTGRVLPPHVLDAITHVAARHHLWVIADEAYDELYFDDRPAPPLYARPELEARVLAVHTASKRFAVAGARIGWVHGEESAVQAVRDVHTFTSYNAPRPLQRAVARALDEATDYAPKLRATYREAAERVADALGLEPPRGGTFVFFDAGPWLPDDAPDVTPFLEACADEGVLLTPGAACGRAYGRFARLCYTYVPPAALDDALLRLRRVPRRERR